MNKSLVGTILMTLLLSVGLTSCNTDAENSTTYYGNSCAITNMVLGTLYRDVHTTTSAGKDSTYTTTFSGSLYSMYIDQYKGEIYNPDSLPMGTRIKKILFTTASCDGILAYRTDWATDTVYSTTDTMDFTNPRIFTCYSYSGLAKKTYNVHVNIHQVNPEKFVWNQVLDGDENIKAITSQRAFCKAGQVYVFAIASGKAVVMTPDMSADTIWTTKNISLTGFDPCNVQLFNNAFYTVQNGQIMTSENGVDWTATSTTFTADALPAVSSNKIYAIKDSKMYASKDALTWEADSLEGTASELPTSGFTSVCSKMTFNDNFEYVIMGGTNANGNVEWKKIIDNKGDNTEPWSLYKFDAEKHYPYPSEPCTQVLSYDDKLFSMNIEGDTLSLFKISTDYGRTWKPYSESYLHPTGIKGTNYSWVVDDDKYMWIICGGSGIVWRGRMNRLSFPTNQTAFTE